MSTLWSWFTGTAIGKWLLVAGAAVAVFSALMLGAFLRGRNAAVTEQAIENLRRVTDAARARATERMHPTDETTDPFNRRSDRYRDPDGM